MTNNKDALPPLPQQGEAKPVQIHDLADVFERPFTDHDDPRLRCAKVLTLAEAEAVLEHRGDLVAALSCPAEAQARVIALEAALREARLHGNLHYHARIAGQNDEYCDVVDRIDALLSGSTPKPAGDASTEAVALEFEQALRGEARPGDELYGVWEAIGRDARLKLARQKLSAHEITLIVGHARATAPKPAGVEIDDAMIERAALALQQVRYERLKELWDTKGASLMTDEPSGMRDDARAALSAALSGDAG